MSVSLTVMDVTKCALIALVHTIAAVIKDLPKMAVDAKVNFTYSLVFNN